MQVIGYVPRPMKDQDDTKQQMGVRINGNLLIEAKVLAARQRRRLNEVIEEAIQDLLKKYETRRKERG
jgi:predicted HicB family RNase H-like nuclease